MIVGRIARVAALTLLPSLLSAHADAQIASRAMPATATNGPWQDPAFFPISVWWQTANTTGHSGPYANLAAAAAASHINIFIGQGMQWPERFGSDDGELEAVQQAGVYLIGGVSTPSAENVSPNSVASMTALAGRIGAQSNLIGYNAGDEPQCAPGYGQTAMSAVPSVVAAIQAYDPTRIVTFNQTDWMVQPQWQHQPCLAQDIAALQSAAAASFDVYPATSPYVASNVGVGGTDYATVSNDSLWLQGLSVQAMRHFAAPNQPLWAYIEAGGDNFGLSEVHNALSASVRSGSATLLNNSGQSRFTATWIGLAVSGTGIPDGTTITGVTDATHATMSVAATATASGSVTIGTYGMGDCVASVNLCVVNGNEYRPTAAQVNAEVWMSIINGATGIEYFCHDSTSYSFCLGDSAAGGVAATNTQLNLANLDRNIAVRARVLNAPTVGMCSMQQFDFTAGTASMTTSCSDGILAMSAHDPAVPGAALVKSYGGSTFLIAQSDRRSPAGGGFSYTLAGLGGHTAHVLYDSNERYDRANTSLGATFTLNGTGQFTDTLGAHHDDYQVKIYRID